jgi:hypothetical protein
MEDFEWVRRGGSGEDNWKNLSGLSQVRVGRKDGSL